MAEDKLLSEFVDRLRSAAGNNLVCITLHGSAAAADFHPDFSDINLLCVVRDLSPATLESLSAPVRWWTGQKRAAPLLFAQSDLERSADAFPIEMLDITRQHRILFGEDVFKTLRVPMEHHRTQLEHELRTKLLLLRQHYLLACNDERSVRRLMLDSVSNFITLFRHALIAMAETPAATKRDVAQQMAKKAGFDAAVFDELLAVREHKAKVDTINGRTAFGRYVQAIEKAVLVVDAS